MDKEKSDKTAQIISTAQKWFASYGLQKTSMQEIANDLGLSKASLYYYFPDKESLYRAVIEKEQQEFIYSISEKIRNIRNPEKVLPEYITARLDYFRKLMNLSRLRYEEFSDIKPVLRDLLESFRETEKKFISGILKAGVENGDFMKMDTEHTASLFLDLIKGLRISMVTSKNRPAIEPEEFDRLLKRTLEFTHIFIRGIKKQ